MNTINQPSSESLPVCPHCGSNSATTYVTERYAKSVDFNGLAYGMSENKIISGGKRFLCDGCNRDVSKLIPEWSPF